LEWIEFFCLCLDLTHPLKRKESFHLVFELAQHILIIRVLLQSVIFRIQKPLNVVLMIFWGALTVHLGVVIEEVGVDLVEEPGLLQDDLLHENEEGRRDPIDKGACRPLMRERQMQELQNLEEGAETIHKPMLILFCDSSLYKML
jgi:hypothetical protein